MNSERISELLRPFLSAQALPATTDLNAGQLESISIYVDLLLRWNARVNLTAVRDAESIVTRHFGESLFLAACLFPSVSSPNETSPDVAPSHALDLGSGAGFPGLPLKIYAPHLRLTLVESNHKKAVFLGEVIRALQLSHVSVFSQRLAPRLAPQPGDYGLPGGIAPTDLVTMRAVERFESALATAAAIIRHGAARLGSGKLALLIGLGQGEQVRQSVSDFSWRAPVPVPQSRERVLLVGRYPSEQAPRK